LIVILLAKPEVIAANYSWLPGVKHLAIDIHAALSLTGTYSALHEFGRLEAPTW